jgi:Spy/CpxP family protein refolding chaperone
VNALQKLWAVALLAVPLCAGAADGKGGDDWLRGKLFPPDVVLKYQSQLKLTDAQRQAIRREIVAVQAKVAPLDFDLMDAATALQEALDKPQIDRELVLQKTDAALQADTRKKRAWIEMLLNVRAALTPEQVAYLKKATGDASP